MKTVNYTTTEAEALNPSALRHFSNVCRAKLEELKTDLVHRFTSEFAGVQSYLVRRAVEEADDLASATGLPFLVLPGLAEEKVRLARDEVRRASFEHSLAA